MKSLLRAFALLILLALAGAAALLYDAQRLLSTPLALEEVERVTIERGGRLHEVIDNMAAQGDFLTPRQGWYLLAYARFKQQHSRIKAGDFDLAPGLSPLDALEMFVDGRSILSELRLPEGWRFDQALDLIRSHPDLEHSLPDEVSAAQVMTAIGLPEQHPEGRFFPDTYRFSKGLRDVDFLRHAHALLARTLAEEWAARAEGLDYASPDEALIMASIVEKETGAAFERARIAGVFLRRLKTGMRLQTDPTVIYGLGETFDGNLRRVHLETDGPYNSYSRTGLPPTPICLPGRAAIHAALHPEDDGSVFFVAKGDGSHQFSKTLAEHNAAVARYQLRR